MIEYSTFLTHRVHHGAATTLAIVQTCTKHELHLLQPVFHEGEDRVGFELVEVLDVAAAAIIDEVQHHGILANIFLNN